MQIAHREKIERILERIAYQIAEAHYDKKQIVFVGIKENGLILAQEVIAYLSKIWQVDTKLIALQLDKKKPEKSNIHLSEPIPESYDAMILVDDVINSGRTFFYALRPFLDLKIQSLQTLILVERKYKRFPIIADYVGISLNTTLKEHIEVIADTSQIQSIELQ